MLKLIVVLLLVVLNVSAPQQSLPAKPVASPLARWEGNWTGEGKFFGQSAVQRLQWEQVLDGKFTRLTVRVETASGQPMFEGHAYYRQVEGAQFEARWFDSQSHIYPIKAQLDADALTAFWGEPLKEEGKSAYKLLDAGKQLEVVDAVRTKEGSWREFGRFVLKRSTM